FGELGPVLPRVEVAGPRRGRDEDGVGRLGTVAAADEQQLRAGLDDRPVGPPGRQRDLLWRDLPRDRRPDGRRARQRQVRRRAEVDRAPGEDAEVDRPVDREVVGPVRNVAQQEDDQDEPEHRLDRRPAPAVAIEQPEEGPASRRCSARWKRRLLRHRPPVGPRRWRRPVGYLTVSVPVIVVGWTWQRYL